MHDRPMYYVLDEDNNPVPLDVPHAPFSHSAAAMREWGEFMGRKVGHTIVGDPAGKHIEISTVFLGIDHNFQPGGRPVLFETMVFGGKFDQNQARYCTWKEAEEGHRQVVELVTSGKIKARIDP